MKWLAASFLTLAMAVFGSTAARAETCGVEIDPETAAIRVPFNLERNWAMVDVHINGQGPYSFMVDTGATGIGRVDTSIREALELPSAGSALNSDGVNTRSIDRVSIDDLRIGDYALADVVLLSRDYNRGVQEGDLFLPGIVALNFFDGGLIEFDYPNRTLTFTTNAQLSEDSPYAVPITGQNDIPARIGNAEFAASIDTGSTLTMHLDQSLYEQFDASPLEFAGQGHRANTVFQLHRTTIFDQILISGASTSNVEIMVSDRGDANNIGGGFLQDFVLQIDLRSNMAAICPERAS